MLDPRRLRFAAWPTIAMLAAVLVTGPWLLATLLATAAALSAALLNAAFGLCLGCELYLLIKRTTHRHEGATA